MRPAHKDPCWDSECPQFICKRALENEEMRIKQIYGTDTEYA